MVRVVEILAAGGGWMLSFGLMVDGTIDRVPAMRQWSLLTSLVAWVPTLCLVMQYHRGQERAILKRHRARERDVMMAQVRRDLRTESLRVEDLIQAVAIEFAQAELPRIERRTSSQS